MVEFRYLHGAVYVFENLETQRVKIGVTTNDVLGRLGAINDMWLRRKVTCQICGGRVLVRRGLVPKHVLSGIGCPGGNELPLETDVALAESHLEQMRTQLDELAHTAKASAARKIKTLEKRIEIYRHLGRPVGVWLFRAAFYTECAEQVELRSHEILAERLDKLAPFGEVFRCSVSEATEAIESALREFGLQHSVRREASR